MSKEDHPSVQRYRARSPPVEAPMAAEELVRAQLCTDLEHMSSRRRMLNSGSSPKIAYFGKSFPVLTPQGGHALNALPQLASAKVNCRIKRIRR